MPESMQRKFRGVPSSAARTVGATLIGATLLEIAVMAHHPSVPTPNVAEAMEQLRAMAALSAWVHGLLITLMLVGYYGLTEFARRRGLYRLPVRAAIIAYTVGVFAMIGAASISGFVTPHAALLGASASLSDLRVSEQILALCGLLNRTLADLGAVAMSAGIVLWSLDLLRGAGLGRVVGVAGTLIGLAPAIALIFGMLQLDVHGMLLVVLLQAIWTCGVGTLLVLERV
jgi:hypothetical protein